MNDQPGLSTNLPWLLNDENTLEDESESETRQIQTLVIGGCARKFLDVTPPGKSWRGVPAAFLD